MNPAPFCTICLPIISPFLLNLSLHPWSCTQKSALGSPLTPLPPLFPSRGRDYPGLAWLRGAPGGAWPFSSPSPGYRPAKPRGGDTIVFQRGNAILPQMSPFPLLLFYYFLLHSFIFVSLASAAANPNEKSLLAARGRALFTPLMPLQGAAAVPPCPGLLGGSRPPQGGG